MSHTVFLYLLLGRCTWVAEDFGCSSLPAFHLLAHNVFAILLVHLSALQLQRTYKFRWDFVLASAFPFQPCLAKSDSLTFTVIR